MQVGYFDEDNPEHRALAKRIFDCLDASELADFSKTEALAEAAICLKEVLDRVEIPAAEEIPGPEELLDEDSVRLDRWQLPGTRIFIHLVEEGPQKHEYVFTPGTVSRAVETYEEWEGMEYRDAGPATSPGLYRWYVSAAGSRSVGYVVDRLPEWCGNRIFDLAIWQWFTLIVGLIVSLSCCLPWRIACSGRLPGDFWKRACSVIR